MSSKVKVPDLNLANQFKAFILSRISTWSSTHSLLASLQSTQSSSVVRLFGNSQYTKEQLIVTEKASCSTV